MKASLNPETISNSLLANSVQSLAEEDSLIVLHDPSDIRKPYAKILESLGKVRNLDGNIVNGYSTFNSVAVDCSGKTLKLLDSIAYSNGDKAYLNNKDLATQTKDPEALSVDEKARYDFVRLQIASGNCHNLTEVTYGQLQRTSEALKKTKPERKLVHVLDRYFDDNNVFRFIDSELKDEFVIRAKSSRCAEALEQADRVKLIDMPLENHGRRNYSKLMIKGKTYQDIKVYVEFGTVWLGNTSRQIVRITLLQRNGKSVFTQPMMLMTNREVNTEHDAWLVYEIYLKRSKIEGVFKFAKEALGWEEIRVRDFESIKTFLVLCYFIVGYFYEIGEAASKDSFIIWLAELGGGNGKVTRYFLLEGLSMYMVAHIVEEFKKAKKITEEQDEYVLSLGGLSKNGRL